jgi:acyl carrier protein
MVKKEIEELLIEIIQDILPDEDCSNLDHDIRLREQLGLDSMDFLDIVMELRKKYGVEVPEADYPNLATINSSVNYLVPLIKEKNPK